MMTMKRVFAITGLLAASCGATYAQGAAAVLAKMDAASKTFRNAQADFQWDYFQKIVHDTTTDKGSIYFERNGATTIVGAMLAGGPGGKAKQVIAYTGADLQVFTPAENQLQVFHSGGSQSDYQGFLTLGFGGSGADLQAKWTITDNGPETLNIAGASVATEKLNLVPKDPGMAKSFKNVEMWVDTNRGIGVKEIFYTATGGNYRTATYSNIRLGAKIDKGHYGIGADNKVKTDKSTQVFNH
jgi:outer membrane lipoprotein-sorting protein